MLQGNMKSFMDSNVLIEIIFDKNFLSLKIDGLEQLVYLICSTMY
jgi:hypothetical protein